MSTKSSQKKKRKNTQIAINNKKLQDDTHCQYSKNTFQKVDLTNVHLEKCGKKLTQRLPKKNPVYKTHATDQKRIENDSIYDFDVNDGDNIADNVHSILREQDLDHCGSVIEDSELNDDNRKCNICQETFSNAVELLRHTSLCHSIPRKIVSPSEVEQYFDNADRSFCPICAKSIKTRNYRSLFIKHLLIHTSGLTYKCKVCNKTFRRKDNMRAHERRHVVSSVD